MDVTKLTAAITKYIRDTENAELNYQIALIYEELKQTSAAIGFFLRAAERTNDMNLAYECLLKVGLCFERQTRRNNTVRVFYKHAVLLLPKRPEAYFLLSRFYERTLDRVSGYLYAQQGLDFADFNQVPLRGYVEYPGKYGLIFEKMVCSWWWGKVDECRALLVELRDKYKYVMDGVHIGAVQNNLNMLGVTAESHVLRPYKIWQKSQLRYKFKDYDKIYRNFSQVYQDLFTLSMLDGKRNGTYLEIGTAGPDHGNNTKLLEELGWTGVGIEWDKNLAASYAAARKNPVLNQDALKTDYIELTQKIAVNGVIDYLQLDCEPASTTYEIMTRIPFNLIKFAVITYEHDDYVDMTGQYRNLSRAFLRERGYELVVSDISPDGVSNFEDWWVHPDLVSKDIIRAMKDTSNRTKHATEYMLSEPFIEFKPEEVNGLDTTNNDPTFTSCLLREVITERIYERYRSVQDGDVVVDLGANIGLFPWSFKNKLYGRAGALVVAVEPSPSLIPTLTNNMSKLIAPTKVFNYAIGGTTEERKVTDTDWLAGDVPIGSTLKVKTFKDFLADAQLEKIDFLKVDVEGAEYDIFTEENYEFLTKNVKYITGEWHLSYAEDGLNKFINFKNLYLKGKNNFRVFEPYDWREVTHKILDDAYLHEFYNWRNPRNKGAQFMVYIDNG